MTLAPEVCPQDVIQYLINNDVIVSAGHSNATYEEAISAFNSGIHAATHLFNAMSAFQHRAPGMIGGIFGSDLVKASVVADGYHVDFPVIRIAKQVMGERLFLITDAVTENTSGSYRHHLEGNKYVVPGGILSGSALTMLKAVTNCVEQIGLPLEEALRMASLYPAQVIKADYKFGKIKNGYAAELLWLDPHLKAKGMFTNGRLTIF
jgi:N-acetylglucosamine-6-phosphate deacetylase